MELKLVTTTYAIGTYLAKQFPSRTSKETLFLFVVDTADRGEIDFTTSHFPGNNEFGVVPEKGLADHGVVLKGRPEYEQNSN